VESIGGNGHEDREETLMSLCRTILLVALLTALCSGRPLAPEEGTQGRACLKGETDFSRVVLAHDFPSHFLNWAYEEPKLVEWFLDYSQWEAKYRNYFRRNYGDSSLTFRPSMIVMHFTVVPTAEATHALLQRNKVSVQLMIDTDGTVFQLMPLDRRCNGAYGVNHKALSIEMVARTEDDLLSRSRQVFSSFCLVRHLMSQFDIPLSKVVGHSEVGEGVTRVPEYLDLHDRQYPTRYPPWSKRTDPGDTYMSWLRTYLALHPPN